MILSNEEINRYILNISINDFIKELISIGAILPQAVSQEIILPKNSTTSVIFMVDSKFKFIEKDFTLFSSDPSHTRRSVYVDYEDIRGIVINESNMIPNLSDSVEKIDFGCKWKKENLIKINCINTNINYPSTVVISILLLPIQENYYENTIEPFFNYKRSLVSNINNSIFSLMKE